MMIDGLNVFIAGLEAKWCAFTQQEHRAAPRARAPILARARDFLLNLQLCIQLYTAPYSCIMRCPSGPEFMFKM